MNLLLRTFIKKQGWSDYGVVDIATLAPKLKEHKGIFERWVEKGFHADLEYLENMKEDRYCPENKLPDVKTVIVLSANYSSESGALPTGRQVRSSESSQGIVARYAGGKDYHKVLRKKLIELSNFLKSKNPQAETYVSVDSGPIVDRVLAESAGLGFFGKNSMIINPAKGSYFFLASMLTNLDLTATPKRRMPNCGDCNRCATACPTGALKGPGVIDAKLCISYLTIENKEGIPVELRDKIGNRLFGCDICQEVCPFNAGRAHKQEIRIKKLSSESGVGSSLRLEEILSIRTDEQFLERFAGTPLMRAKRRGLLRNACVVAGNSGDKELIPYLNEVIERESDKMLKEHAQWAIDQLSKKEDKVCHSKESKKAKTDSLN